MTPIPTAETSVTSPHPFLRVRLAIMMFLQYAIWGAWLPLAPSFLKEHRGLSDSEVGTIVGFGAIGAIFAPFIAGQIADRYLATQKFLAISHLLGAVLVWQLAELQSFTLLLAFAITYSLLYAPTMPLTNSLAFHHLTDRDRDFGRIRLFGTIGWIAVGIGFGQWLAHYYTPAGVEQAAVRAQQVSGMADSFKLSAILGAVMGVYCLTLPHTPPKKGAQKFAPFEALTEVRLQPLLTLFLLSIPVSILHQFHMYHTAGFLGHLEIPKGGAVENFNKIMEAVFGVGGSGIMTLGQFCEIFCLASIPFVAKRFSKKSILAFGLICYAARFAIFAWLPTLQFIIPGLLLHGPIFACFIFLAFTIVDEECTADVRASAQGLYNLIIVGFGVVLGSKVSGWIGDHYTDKVTKAVDYAGLFAGPVWGALACLVLLLMFYPAGRRATSHQAIS